MDSIKEIYRIGRGPSSSHTMGPKKAAELFLEMCPEADSFEVTLYGSLAATGKGHMTDVAILDVLKQKGEVNIVWEPKIFLSFHPNGMKFCGFDKDKNEIKSWIIYSIGGGALANEESAASPAKPVYDMNNLHDIQEFCEAQGCSYWEYVEMHEGPEIWNFLQNVWDVMVNAVERGLEAEGVLPGGLGVRRKASDYLIRAKGYKDNMKNRGMLYAYALATSEENAAGGEIVTAPTCGSCGVVPGVLYYLKKTKDFRDSRVLRALATAGLIGSVVRQNASVSGAQVGCQGEVGVACAMAAAAACQLFGGTTSQIEYAAEMGLEHHLGLTCDPVCGLVQIPCIERNAYAAARALDCNTFATFSDGRHRVSFDKVVEVMRQTGHDLPSLYKETSEGGLAKNYYSNKHYGATE
ncbi:MAG: L-serine ammonia-lyase [Bacteroidales bacterium]|nr:L-serine ammonia-lyase [Bacteroidales bacterium]